MQTAGIPDADTVDADDRRTTPVTLRSLLWRSFLKTAILPLLFIELVFLGIFVLSSLVVYRENVVAASASARAQLDGVAAREAENISITLSAVARNTSTFADQTGRALRGNHQPSAAEKSRYGLTSQGQFHSRYDNGTTASYISAYRPFNPGQLNAVWKLSSLDSYMIDAEKNDPLVVSVYVNTKGNYNLIYPYFDVLKQYPKNLDVRNYNFYYLADERHNPQRGPVWTNAYADPAGHGWMISSIAPVWIEGQLEAVVGQDVTLETIARRLRGLDLPWNSFAMLVDRDGKIIAMPPAGEKALGLTELTSFSYLDTVKSDTLKPAKFDLSQRPDTRPLTKALRQYRAGRLVLSLGGRALVSFSHIDGPDWSLVIVAPESEIFAQANHIRERQAIIGWIMAAMLVLFYILFFVFLYSRAKRMSERMAEPIARLGHVVQRIGQGQFRQQFERTRISEIDDLGGQLVTTGRRLGEAYDTIVEQERVVAAALQRQRQTNEEQARFLRVMSHEIRTPLAIIDSGAQILDRKADSLAPDSLRDRASRMRRAVERISLLLKKLGQSFEQPASDAATASGGVSLLELATSVAAEIVPPDRLVIPAGPLMVKVADMAPVAVALRAVLDNAMRFATQGTEIRVSVSHDGGQGLIVVTDFGPGIPPSELPMVGERFFRGSNAATLDGAGLGIYVARNVLESAGGALDLSSSPAGTVVTLRMPLTESIEGAIE